MRIIFLALSILFTFNFSLAQNWKSKMHDPNVNVYDVVNEAEAYFETVDKTAKGSGWKPYQRWLHVTESKFYPSGDRSMVDPYFATNAYKGFLQNSFNGKDALFNNGWEELGPYYIDQVSGHYSLGLGRVESFYVDPNDSLRIYLGSRSGGFWKTLDGGINWTGSTTNFLVATGVNVMAVSPTNADSILINIRNAKNANSHGIYRSTDAGDTWTPSNFTPPTLGWGGLGTNERIYDIKYHPTIPNLVFVAANSNVYRSTDNLVTWTTPLTNEPITQIEFHPTNPNIVYAKMGVDSFIYRSLDAGVTWSQSNKFPGFFIANTRISTSADCPTCVFVGSGLGIYKSIDEGQNFTLVSTPGISLYGGFAVSDADTSIMLLGDIDVNMSTDGGRTFNKTTFWSQGNATYFTNTSYVHADIRFARYINGVLWIGSDGFLANSYDDGITWQRYEGVSIRENYSLGVSQSNHYRTIIGSQDNGTSIFTENGWLEFYGADGMEGVIHPLNDDYMIGSVQNGTRRSTLNGGLNQQGVTPPASSNGTWIAPLAYDPNEQMRIYDFRDSLFRSDDFCDNWVALGTPSFSNRIDRAAIAENNSNIIVVSQQANIEKSIDGGLTFASIRGTLPNNAIRDIAFDPNNDDVIIVVYDTYQNNGNKVFMSTDQGTTWQNISYNLNDMPIQSVVIDHTNASTIYLGAEIGVYKKAMADTVWTLYNPDLPNMTVYELEVVSGSNTLRAATWGRGLWEFTLDGRQSYPAILTTKIDDLPTLSKPKFGVDQFVTSVISYDSTLTNVYTEWSINTPVFGNVIPMTNTVDSTWVSNTPLPQQPVGTKIFFKVLAVGSSGDTTETYKFMYEVKPFALCIATGTSSAGNLFLQDVEVANMTNTSGNTAYSYYGNKAIEIHPDSTYNINLTGVSGWMENDYAAWIDYNDNAEFDSTELILWAIDSSGAANTTFTVPSNPTLSDTLILRLRLSYFGDNPLACGAQFGEVEDYPVYITLACSNSGTDIRTECGPITWIDGNTYTSNNNTATHLLTNAAGCDSLVTLNLTISTVNTNVSVLSNTITASAISATYQWLDCNSALAPIPSETNQSFTASASGSYAVEITQSGCVDTSICQTITISGIIESDLKNLNVYPNPTAGNIVIDLGENLSGNIEIFDAAGKLVGSKTFNDADEVNITLEGAVGYYLIELISTDNKKAVLKVLKE